MAEIVKLGKLRKQRARAQKVAQADANAVAFGRTKAQKEAERARRDAARNKLDGHRQDEHRRDGCLPDGDETE